MKAEKYVLVAKDMLGDFNRSVNDWIAKGYQPFGSPMLTGDGNYCQAMVKYADIEAQVVDSFELPFTVYTPESRCISVTCGGSFTE